MSNIMVFGMKNKTNRKNVSQSQKITITEVNTNKCNVKQAGQSLNY